MIVVTLLFKCTGHVWEFTSGAHNLDAKHSVTLVIRTPKQGSQILGYPRGEPADLEALPAIEPVDGCSAPDSEEATARNLGCLPSHRYPFKGP